MKKRMLFAVAAVLLVCVAAPAQDAKQAGDQPKPESTSPKEMSKKAVSITGKVSTDGLTLVGDKDNKTYKVMNPDFLKENAGQRVRVNARVSKDNSEILVSSVMVQNDEPIVANKGDDAFRRCPPQRRCTLSIARRLRPDFLRRGRNVFPQCFLLRIFRTSIFEFRLPILAVRLHLLASGGYPHYSVSLI